MSAAKFPRSFVTDFNEVIGFFQRTYPAQWPEPERAALTEEAKAVARNDREEAIRWYGQTAKCIRETGWWC